jgi:hypothetical protein
MTFHVFILKMNVEKKLMIRQLPPTLTEKVLLDAVSKETDLDLIDWFYFSSGQINKTSYSTAYLHFKQPTEALLFKKKWDGHVFKTKGDVDIIF